MKTIKYIFAIICLFSFVGGGFSSCTDEIEKKDNAGTGIANSLQLQLTIPDNEEIAPMTKSSQSESEGVNDLSILIYEVQNGSLAEHFYYSADQLQGLTTDEKFIKIGLTQIAPGQKRVYLIANIGSESAYNTLCGQVRTENELKAYSVGLNGTKPAMLLAAQGDRDFDAQTGAQVSASLKRIYSMITVKVVRNLKDGLVINPKSVQLKHVPTTGFLFKDNKIENENQCGINGEMIERTGGNTNFLTDDHSTASALYMFENRQPDGSNGGDQTTKTPAGLKPDALIESIKTDRKCSYIEVVADYLKGGQSGVSGSGTITYRFFLGKDALKNFDVQRNVHYLVTLTLNGDGGKDEATWRVETDLMKEMNVPNAYVGYRVGSRTEIQATGDYSIGTVTSADSKINVVSFDRNTGKIVVEALETNTHDYEKQSYRLNYTVDGVTKTAYVYQVPRLVDPIAYYMKADNTSEQFVEVKEFSKEDRAYTNLVSEGPWTATILAGDWFDLYKERGDLPVSGESAVIKGDGEVKFYYRPREANANKDKMSGATLDSETSDGARYGVILVKYHNEKCPHEIFLRQGYQPTTLGQAAWSMFNCIGDDASGDPQITDYPTSTGWFFKGGNDIGINPYNPGYQINPNGKLYFSNGRSGSFNDNNYDVSHWKNTSGPCPAGYKVADSYDFESLVKSSTVYTGFVHDDGPAGWRYDGTQVELENNNYCNPAKGSLFVSSDGTGKSVFFTFGKGVLTQHPNGAYIDEIGVGHRGSNGDNTPFGVLAYDEWVGNTKKYGAIYWTSTHFGGTSNSSHLGKADFSYDILKSTPYAIDVPTNPKAAGLHGKWHGNFVRCVRSGSGSGGGETMVTFKPSATFKYWDGSRYGDNIKGTITVSYDNDRKTATFLVEDGKATNSLTLPKNVTSVKLSYSWYYTYTKSNVSVTDLQSSKTITLAPSF